MHAKVCSVLFAFAFCVNAQEEAYPTFGSRIQSHDTPAEYNFSYDVRDDTTGDRKSQEESRSGDQVRGRYSVLDADGSTRTVEYSVDAHSGFNAVVRRDGDLISVPETRGYPYYTIDQRRPISQTSIRDHQRDRSRTRLAQDARTVNVVDLNSGFGAHLQLINDRPEGINGDFINFITRNNQISNQVQEHLGTAGIPNQGVNHDMYNQQENRQFTPTNRPHSTGPVHFPYHSLTHDARLNNARNRLGIRPVTPVDVRTPAVLRADSNINRNTQDTNRVSNPIYPTSVFNPNQYTQQDQIPTNPALHYGPTPQAVLESNNTRIALYSQHDHQFGARIHQHISSNDDTVVVDNPTQYNYNNIPQQHTSQQQYYERQQIGNTLVDLSINAPSAIEYYRFPANTRHLADTPNFDSRNAIDHTTSPMNIYHGSAYPTYS